MALTMALATEGRGRSLLSCAGRVDFAHADDFDTRIAIPVFVLLYFLKSTGLSVCSTACPWMAIPVFVLGISSHQQVCLSVCLCNGLPPASWAVVQAEETPARQIEARLKQK